MKISCSSPMVPGKSITEKAMKLKKWGYDAIALFVDYETWTEEQHQEVLQLKNETDIIPCEFVFSSPIYGHLMDEGLEAQKGFGYSYMIIEIAFCGQYVVFS